MQNIYKYATANHNQILQSLNWFLLSDLKIIFKLNTILTNDHYKKIKYTNI